MTTYLLDANVLISLVVAEHEHHDRASRWLSGVQSFAVCPIVEGALVRFLVRLGESSAVAQAVVHGVHDHPRCQFWEDSMSYAGVDLTDIVGHRQVTDAYLAALAATHDGRLATMDGALARRHANAATLVPA